MKRKTFSKLITLVVYLICLLGFPMASLGESVSLKLGHAGAPNTVYDVASRMFAERVAENTKGKVEVKIYGGSMLGNIPQHWGQIKTGTVDMFMTDPVLAFIPEPKPKNFLVMASRYIFETQEHYHKFIKSDLFRSMMTKVEKASNIKYVGYLGDRPPRALTTSDRKVMSPADVKGLKIRVLGRISVETWKAMGANPTPVPAAEIYTSLKTGLVEAQDNPILYTRDLKLYEVQKYFITIDYMRSGMAVWMNQQRWDSLPADVKEAIIRSTEETTVYMNKYVKEQVALAEKELEEKGMIIIRPDLKSFKVPAEKIAREKFEGNFWEKGLYDKIRAMK